MTLPLRGARAFVFALVATLAAASLHAAAGSPLPSPLVISVAVGGVFALAAALAGSRRSSLQISVGLLGAQAVLHVLFEVACSAATPATDGAVHASHGAGVAPPSATMLLAHVAAAALAGCWLGWGERRVWASARRVTVWMRHRLAPAPARLGSLPRSCASSQAAGVRVSEHRRPVVDGSSWRGPPAAAPTG